MNDYIQSLRTEFALAIQNKQEKPSYRGTVKNMASSKTNSGDARKANCSQNRPQGHGADNALFFSLKNRPWFSK